MALAQHIPVEVISVDSALVYRGMDVGSAKPSLAERALVPHHLIDVCEPLDLHSAADFARAASALIAAIQQRGRLPLLVGGTMLYFKALIDGLDPMPASDATVRAGAGGADVAALRPGCHAAHGHQRRQRAQRRAAVTADGHQRPVAHGRAAARRGGVRASVAGAPAEGGGRGGGGGSSRATESAAAGVLDRIRENRGKLPYANSTIINDSINQTFSRTLITGGTTLVSCTILYFAGGEGMRAFAFCLTTGLIFGTYSSIAVAAPIVWSRKHDNDPGVQDQAQPNTL
jgi:hypothetical protein